MMRFVFLLFILFGFNSRAAEIEVCKTCEISSVSRAIEMAEDGDVIRIKSGIYKEHEIQLINKAVRIIGDGYPVIDAEFKGNGFSIRSENFSVEGLKIINIGSSHTKDFAGMLISNSRNFQIRNNKMDDIFFGILLERSSGGEITGNIMKSAATDQAKSGNGIHLWNVSELMIRDNMITGMRDGIYIEFGKKCEILNNVCRDNLRYGLHFMFSDHNSYVGNIFQNNGAGVAVMFSKFIEMRENLFKKNWGAASYGLLLKEITDATLKHNVFEDNTIAVNADGTTRVDFTENDFLNNGYAVRVHGGVYSTNFHRNNFMYNAFDLAYAGRLNDNDFDGNYWSDYTGYDLDRDGVGDVPYRPVKLFSYLVNKTPEAIVLLRSLFIDLLDFSEKVSPIFTPAELVDRKPQIKRISW